MATRIYIGPTELSGSRRKPKYIPALGYSYGAKYYGSEDVVITAVRDITPTDHTTLVANPDIIAIPENLNANMTQGQVNAAVTFYDSLNLPSGWINTNRTVKQVVKITVGLFMFNQRWRGLANGSSPGFLKD